MNRRIGRMMHGVLLHPAPLELQRAPPPARPASGEGREFSTSTTGCSSPGQHSIPLQPEQRLGRPGVSGAACRPVLHGARLSPQVGSGLWRAHTSLSGLQGPGLAKGLGRDLTLTPLPPRPAGLASCQRLKGSPLALRPAQQPRKCVRKVGPSPQGRPGAALRLPTYPHMPPPPADPTASLAPCRWRSAPRRPCPWSVSWRPPMRQPSRSPRWICPR